MTSEDEVENNEPTQLTLSTFTTKTSRKGTVPFKYGLGTRRRSTRIITTRVRSPEKKKNKTIREMGEADITIEAESESEEEDVDMSDDDEDYVGNLEEEEVDLRAAAQKTRHRKKGK